MTSAIRFVLVDTSHPGNLGACARAMKNMGLDTLVLVRPRAHGDPEAAARAAGAADVLARARLVATVEDAIGDCGRVYGTSARARSALFRVLDAREAAAELAEVPATRPAAVLFGGERNGLSNDALERCHALIRIPCARGYASLNLAQAVQILAYEIHMAGPRDAVDAPPQPATADEMRALDAHLERVMRSSGFMHDANAAQLGVRLRRLFARARPDDGEVRILRGWLAAMERGLGPAELER
jgi:tRNA (cytidine32/uridine32-2'-O)-methyltransferase